MRSTPTITRPKRWDQPFGDDMNEGAVERLLGVAPFRQMDEAAFPDRLPLRAILAGDARVVAYKRGDLIIREGDYGASAFLLLHGAARVSFDRLDGMLGNGTEGGPSGLGGRLLRAVTQLWQTPAAREVRRRPRVDPLNNSAVGVRSAADHPTVFLQDVPRVIAGADTAPLKPGEVFGELGALTRSPRAATVFAETNCVALEVRWQGLRDLMRYAPEMKRHIDRLYRENSLRVHLRETPLLSHLNEEQLARVADATRFETYGSFDWHADLAGVNQEDLFERIDREPLVAEEGAVPEGLLLLRSGFARVSQRRGDGHQTVAYVGKGAAFGAAALAEGYKNGGAAMLRLSLRAVGYLDVLLIPTGVFVEVIAPSLPTEELDALVAQHESQSSAHAGGLPARTLDFLVDRRLVNGRRQWSLTWTAARAATTA